MNHPRRPGSLARRLFLSLGLLATALGLRAQEQSPIDFHSSDVVRVLPSALPRLDFDYAARADLAVVNTGSPDEFATVRANVPAGAASVTVDGVAYELKQFHFHTPSEHRIEGEEFPMELHLVHQSADGTLLVVGVLIAEGHRHGELEKIFDDLPVGSETNAVPGFKLSRLLPGDRRSLRYRGSLTTPPFTEGVKWVVLVQPLVLSPDDVAAFRNLFPDGNSREPQPLNGRTVQTDAKWKRVKVARLAPRVGLRGTR